ncbi:hypothetical protein I5G62_gp26 [Mycobacterium phage CRB2]|uniref:Tail assembly chaperone n=1 Tax=Mycobacterium phage CRB2 TaxID=2483623 RepID=A0A455LM03_9CAUD|nr:hypothetical protein I5G62_gp26 [Mycobacterium phage CRB2]AYP70012.1 hypothetical protein CRB2_26 [Mycobacterium phage CRB2]
MAKIVIEGSITPAAGLARGERREVQDSKEVRAYVAKGFANVVDEESGEVEAAPLPDPIKPPAKNASTEKWAEFVGEHTDIEVAGKDREELQAAYDDFVARSGAPAADES